MSVTERQQQYLQAMGIQLWVERGAQPAAVPHTPEAESVAPSGGAGGVEALDWDMLESRVAACTACVLHESRTRTVFGVGDRRADWLIVGEAPGADEDRQGEPFVGRAGRLLNEMIRALGMERESVYIANILKCRPPNNRDPRPEEVLCCEPYLKRQVALLAPRIILAVGRVAAQNLLKTDQRIGALRGRRFTYADSGVPVVVTYHPAYLLRSPGEKRKAWEDLQLARRCLQESRGVAPEGAG